MFYYHDVENTILKTGIISQSLSPPPIRILCIFILYKQPTRPTFKQWSSPLSITAGPAYPCIAALTPSFCRAVLLFVLRLLKALDFQPRMALVTRTISNAFTDLIHFIALFAIVFSGCFPSSSSSAWCS
jgi:hypothetical protein